MYVHEHIYYLKMHENVIKYIVEVEETNNI